MPCVIGFMVDATFKRETLHATPLELSVFGNWLGCIFIDVLGPFLCCLFQGRELTSINAWVACLVVSKSIHGLNLMITDYISAKYGRFKKCISIAFIRVVPTFIGAWCSPIYFPSLFVDWSGPHLHTEKPNDSFIFISAHITLFLLYFLKWTPPSL